MGSPPTSWTPQERRRLVDRAWQTYVLDGAEPHGLSDEISRSWQRAREAYRIDPSLARCARVLGADALLERRESDEVFRIAAPILADFAARLGLAGSVLAYFDREGWMLSIDGHGRTVEAIADIGFRPGASWAEDAVGTNGPGTALAEGKPVEVFASEHFVAAWQRWSCAAAPLRAPGEAAPAGLVDITGPWEVQRRQALLLAKAIARAVEERLRAATNVRDEVVRYAFRNAHHAGDALVAVDARGGVLAANDSAARRRLVDAGALPLAARAALADALRRRGADADRETLLEPAGGPRLVIAPVCYEGAPIGAIVRAPAAGGEHARRSRAAAVRSARYDFARIAGESAPLRRAIELARVAARHQLPVVLCGESGTGKELFAHAIHGAGDRAGGPFVAVNCGSIPAQLVESELFGYEAGTFTGGRREGSPGRFEDADGGTLFLDEVSELSGPAQTALLRVLQEREVVRLGGSAPRATDVRVVAATNKPLEEEIRHGRFRRDLYYRLNVLSIAVPPLRERGEDLALLARLFLAEAEAEVGRPGLTLADDGLAALRAHPWPGNVRELRNVLLRAAATARTERIGAEDLLLEPGAPPPGACPPAPAGGALGRATAAAEREALLRALDACRWNFARAAEELGVSRMTLYRRLARHGIARTAPPRR
jgi:transcriptional regulator of acetoin/glycerol metabolism